MFNFRSSLGLFKDDYIKYELGIGLSRKPEPIKRTIILFGKWRIKKNQGLLFEVEYGKRRLQQMVFGAEAKLTKRNTVLFKLKNDLNRQLGAELEVGHKILKGDGQAFLRLLKTRQEATILVGAGWGW